MRAWIAGVILTGVVGAALGQLYCQNRAIAAPAPGLTSTLRGDIDYSAIDYSADACTDFYQRACGGFIARTKVGPGQPEVDMGQREFDANLQANLDRLFATPAPANSELGRLETFYGSCLHDDPANAAIVRTWLRRIDAARSREDIKRLIVDLTSIGVDPFFTYAGEPDPQKLDRNRGAIDTNNLWQEPAVVERAFVLSGEAPRQAGVDTAAVASLVTELRKYRNTSDNPADFENHRTWAQVARIASAMDWAAYEKLVGANPMHPINLTSPKYLAAVSRALEARPVAALRAYLRWTFLFSLRGELPAPYDQAFGDLSPALRVDLNDRAKRCRDATVRAMGVEFSRQYSERILGFAARDAATRIARTLRDQIVASVRNATWLSPAARRATMHKLAETDLKIGFPDRWPAVGHFPLDRRHFLRNVLNARMFEARRAWRRVDQPRSRRDWDMIVYPWVGAGMAAARLVVPNGFPDANSNSLIMTAAFLTPPDFDSAAPIESNYATFGAPFAHEFVHIAEYHQFDAAGHERDIWSPADIAAWEKRRQCVIGEAQADQSTPAAKRTRASSYSDYSENVADLGGLRLAYEALAAKLGAKLNQPDARGMTPAQRFFYKYAQHWCTAATPEDLQKRAGDDPHALPAYRTNVPLSNLPAFGEAFGCKAGSPMRLPDAKICRMW
jgi:putative endopeptidase